MPTQAELAVSRADSGWEVTSPTREPRSEPRPVVRSRLACVDILRGCAIILMTLDHTRSFFAGDTFAPEDLAHASAWLFFTRWVSHFCAPAFFLLAGTGAYLSLWQGRSKNEVSRFLWTRGIWLIVLDLTVINFGWTSEFPLFSGVLWSIGWSMIILSFLIRLPLPAVASFGVLVIGAHNLLDHIRPATLGKFGPLWMIIYGYGSFWIVPGKEVFSVLWPIVPWVGVMACGYVLGAFLVGREWQKPVFAMGTALTAAFVVLRCFHLYGNSDPRIFGVAAGPWMAQRTPMLTVASFFNTLKYPASLQFLLMTLGPLLIALALFSRISPKNNVAKFAAVLGRVPLFYYVVHIYVIHTMAVYVALICKQKAAWLMYGGFMLNIPPAGYGHTLPFVYLMWAIAVLFVYPMCRQFMKLKQAHPDWIVLRYF